MTKGDRIRYLREAAGLSQEEFAKKLGIAKQTIGKYEKNIVTNIPSDRIEKMAAILNSTPEYIMGWESDMQRIIEDAAFDAIVAKDKDIKEMNRKYIALPEDKKIAIRQMVDAYYIAFADGK